MQAVVDVATGEVVQRLEHDEFGRVLFDSHPGLQPFGFAGGLVDADTGLVRFGARDYEPVTGRWTARDPVRFVGLATNRYDYATGDAINFVDPAGAIPTAIGGAIVGGLAGLAGVAGAGIAAGLAGSCGPSLDDFIKAGVGGAVGGAIVGFNLGTGGMARVLAGGLTRVVGGGVGGFVGGGTISF